jgi:hypothetical protein
MSNWRHARAGIALIAAYAVALQTILLTLGIPPAGTAAFAAQPICAASGAAGSGPGPADPAHDCLTACLTGCCGGATAASPLRAAIVVAPYAASTGAIVKARVCALQPPVTGGHRSRAPPRA